MNGLDWNDLRYVLAIARAGSAAGASRQLGVSHVTVLRRVQALERSVGTALFTRTAGGYVPTQAGYRFVETAESFERTMTDVKREVEGGMNELAGTVRFTTSDSIAYCLMPPILESFRVQCPAISVEMRITNGYLDLDRREADVALRPTSAPPEQWVGRETARLGSGIYVHASRLQEYQQADWGDGTDWVVPDGVLAQLQLTRWFRSRVGRGRVVASADSFLVLKRLAEQGLGAVVLPRFVAEPSAGLVCLASLPDEQALPLWLLTHQHLSKAGRIRAFTKHVAAALRELQLP